MKVKELKFHNAVITTRSGRHVDLLFPEAMIQSIDIDDIGYALSRVNRFNGHTSRPYSVAEHCLGGVAYSLPQHKLRFLMHDATEAYLGDKVGPLKVAPVFEEYRRLEKRWDAAIVLRYGLGAADAPKEIHETDKRMLVTEQRDLMGRPPASSDSYQPFAGIISDVTPSGRLDRRALYRHLLQAREGHRGSASMKFFEGIRPSMYFQGGRLKQDKKTSVRYWNLTMAITMKSSEVYGCAETIVSNYEQISCEENYCEELSIAHIVPGFSVEFFELVDSPRAALVLGDCDISNLRMTRVEGLIELWITIEHANTDALHKFVKDYAFTRIWASFIPTLPEQGKLSDAVSQAIDDLATPVREGRMDSVSLTAGGKTVKIDKAAAENIHRNATKGK